jgi:hypothetical protein
LFPLTPSLTEEVNLTPFLHALWASPGYAARAAHEARVVSRKRTLTPVSGPLFPVLIHADTPTALADLRERIAALKGVDDVTTLPVLRVTLDRG